MAVDEAVKPKHAMTVYAPLLLALLGVSGAGRYSVDLVRLCRRFCSPRLGRDGDKLRVGCWAVSAERSEGRVSNPRPPVEVRK